MRSIAKLARYLEGKPITMLILIMLVGIMLRVSILYPSWANGLPSGYDAYIHAASGYFIAVGGLAASPTSPIYPPIFMLLLAFLYKTTAIPTIYMVYPIGIIIDTLSIPLLYYITKRISGNNQTMAMVAAFIVSINPLTLSLLILGMLPFLLGMLGFLLIICIIVSDLYRKPLGILLMGLLGAFIALTHILVFAFLLFFYAVDFIYEVILKRGICYFKSIFFSLLIAIPLAAIYYLPFISYFYFGELSNQEYITYAIYVSFVFPVLCLPALFIVKAGKRRKYVPAGHQHLNILKLWYLAIPLMTLVFIWLATVSIRMYHLLAYPAVVVLGMVFVTYLQIAKRAKKHKHIVAKVATFLMVCMAISYTAGAIQFSESFRATPPRLELVSWIQAHTPQDARFCTEEEPFPTHLAWYIMGLSGRMAYSSYQEFAGPFEVGRDIAHQIDVAYNITTLTALSPDWLSAVRELHVTYAVLLVSQTHPNYAPISNKTVFTSSVYVVYNVTEYAFP